MLIAMDKANPVQARNKRVKKLAFIDNKKLHPRL
jgi:hypothetical protein